MRLLIVVAFALLAGACEKAKPVKQAEPVVVEKTAPAAAPKTDGLPPECHEYKMIIERLSRCDRMPAQSRDALRQGYEAMLEGWKNLPEMPPENKKAMADGCKQGTDALRQAAGALCSWDDAEKVEREP